MAEVKTYTINGREFRLKEEFTIDDWDKSKTVDDFFGQIPMTGKKNNFVSNMTKEQFIDLLDAVLDPVDGKPVEKDFFKKTTMQLGLEIFTNFFFIYLKLNIESNLFLMKSEQRSKELIEKLDSSKTN